MEQAPAYLVSRLISSYVGYLIVMIVLVLIVPKFERVFQDFTVRPPAVTRALMAMSRLCVSQYLWVYLFPVPAFWALVNFNIPNKMLRRRLRLIAFLFVAIFLIMSVVALFLPLIQVMEKNSQRVSSMNTLNAPALRLDRSF